MDKTTEQLKAEIAQTKAELIEKAGEFENRLREDVTNAKDKVEGAIHNVKSVAEGLSLKRLIEKRPLLMLGGSVVAGVVVGSLLAPKSSARSRATFDEGPSLGKRVQDKFPDEIRILKSMAFTYLVNMMADKAKTAYPDFAQKINEFEEKITTTVVNKPES